MSQITTHILDTTIGKPAAGINVILEYNTSGKWELLAKGRTDNDGRVKNLLPPDKIVPPGTFRLVFETRPYFTSKNIKAFYPSVTIEFEITDDTHYHIPLLFSSFGYTTYKGS